MENMSLTTLQMAISAIGRHRLRAGLTTLGISIGIATVVCTVALGQGSRQEMQTQIDSFGEPFVWIQAGSRNVGGVRTGWGGSQSLTPDDAAAIARNVRDVTACSPQVSGRTQAIAGHDNWNTSYQGVTPAFFTIRRWSAGTGVLFTDDDVQNFAKVVVLGSAAADRIFGGDPPVGRTLRMGVFPYRVIGILQERGSSGSGFNQDDAIFLPVTTAQHAITGRPNVSDIVCGMRSTGALAGVTSGITDTLRLRHGLQPRDPDDFAIRSPEDRIQLREQAMSTMTLLLSAMASVSLLVGGIGVMNIMLVSVAERTREIGLRLAIGARAHDIRLQFLDEAILLGLIGGAIGMAGGWGAATFLTHARGWPMLVSTPSVAVAVAVATGTALVFGYYPAYRASKLDPIEALRVET